MATIDFRSPAPSYQQLQHSHRKPLGPTNPPSRTNDLRPLSKIVPDIDYSAQQQRNPSSYSTYSRPAPQASYTTSPSTQQYPQPLPNKSRRSPSQSTTSTAVSTHLPSRTPSNVSSALSRNASTRSGASTTPGSYVALMRKQKATVWCDRAQHEDPRLAAQHKAAKIRAAREITGKLSVAEGRSSTSGSMGSGSLGVRSKIRHHVVPKAGGYSYANMVGGGVPMRLSASEVGDEGSEFEGETTRTNAGRGSVDHRWLEVDDSRRGKRGSQGSTPNSGSGDSPEEHIQELEEPQGPAAPAGGYGKGGGGGGGGKGYFPKRDTDAHGRGSGSSEERENGFGHVAGLEAPTTKEAPRKDKKTEDDLRRRGSVDERTNTMGYMGQGRLFVANPDLSD